MKKYSNNVNSFVFYSPAMKSLLLSAVVGVIALAFWIIKRSFLKIGSMLGNIGEDLNKVIGYGFNITIGLASALLLISILLIFYTPTAYRIKLAVQRRLFSPEYDNPLQFREGCRLPRITCREHLKKHILKIWATSTNIEDLESVSSVISSAINKGRMQKYAVTSIKSDEAMNYVTYYIEDVKKDKKLTFKSSKEMKQDSPTKLAIQEGNVIDISTVGSCLFAGKTRSGKSYGLTSFLIQLLLQGRDNYGSEIIVVDPKGATFQGIPKTILPDEDGSMDKVIDIMKDFDVLRRKRQNIINNKSNETGNEVKWYEMDMNPCYLILDEFVSLRTTQITQKPTKEDPEHCVAVFDSLLKTLAVMGASAGCFVIISIAQASVGEGGLPSIISEAMGTKILFKPSKEEAKLVWKNENMDNLVKRDFEQGDAWFTSNDGVHNFPSFVRFPKMDFNVNEELSKLINAYYSK